MAEKLFFSFLGATVEATAEEAVAWERLRKNATPDNTFTPEPKSHYCEAKSPLGCTTLPCSCPTEWLLRQ